MQLGIYGAGELPVAGPHACWPSLLRHHRSRSALWLSYASTARTPPQPPTPRHSCLAAPVDRAVRRRRRLPVCQAAGLQGCQLRAPSGRPGRCVALAFSWRRLLPGTTDTGSSCPCMPGTARGRRRIRFICTPSPLCWLLRNADATSGGGGEGDHTAATLHSVYEALLRVSLTLSGNACYVASASFGGPLKLRPLDILLVFPSCTASCIVVGTADGPGRPAGRGRGVCPGEALGCSARVRRG